MKTVKPAAKGFTDKKIAITTDTEIKTDFPLSEKDEVKLAEHKLQKAQKKIGK